jgi:hypothetical protein
MWSVTVPPFDFGRRDISAGKHVQHTTLAVLRLATWQKSTFSS